jgi:hypothetical protein
MATFDPAALSRRLDALDFSQVAAFTAACAQRRRAVGVRILEANARSQDAATFDLALEHLWSYQPDSAAPAAWDRLDALPEFGAEEESAGDLAYSDDSIFTLWYATMYARGLGAEYAVHCDSRSYDAAGFLDRVAVDKGLALDQAEVSNQLADLADLEAESPHAAILQRIRARAEAEGERIAAVVPSLG